MTPSVLPFQTEVVSLMQQLRQSLRGDKELQLPLTIGQYKIKRLVGQGGMGDVYEAENLLLKRSEAVKFVRSKLILNPEAIKRFKTEIESTAQLQHPNIVTVYNAGEYEGRPYMVMEFLQGQTIHQYVQDRIRHHNPISIPEAIDIVVQAARGLQYAHEKGFIHRDVKPGNLWITTNGTVKVLDLGLVIPTRHGAKGIRVVGTPDFMPPEQCENKCVESSVQCAVEETSEEIVFLPESDKFEHRFVESRFSPFASRFSTAHCTLHTAHTACLPQSDIYSLGCTLFYILTGHVPFGGKEFSTSDKKMEAQRTRLLPLLAQYRKGIPSRIQKILNRMTAKRPEDRYASMNEVIEVLTSKPVSVPLIVTVTGLALLGITVWGLQRINKSTNENPQVVQTEKAPVPDIIGPFPVGKKAGEKLVRVVDGIEYVFRWCPPGDFLMGNHGVAISEQMSIQELLELATVHHLLNENELLKYKQSVDEITQKETTNTESLMLELQKEQLHLQLYSHLSILGNVNTNGLPKKITLHQGFWTLDCEVTREMWFSVMPGSTANKEIISLNELENAPVRNVSWNDAQEFCSKLSTKLKEKVQLLTEVQWEYACRAGTEETEELIKSQAISFQEGFHNPAIVRSKSPNAWGIYDMPGNVWEWCASESQSEKELKLLRGGCYLYDPNIESLFSIKLNKNTDKGENNAGFRFCVLSK